jgi:hypothetical protein
MFILTALIALGTAASSQQDAVDTNVMAQIRDEGMNHSQIMPTLSYLSDVIGPRLTGSPSLRRANEWTRDKLTSWGLENAKLEAWGPFGRGWQLDRFSAQVTSPMDIPLIAFPQAWSPSLKGTLNSDVVLIDVKDLSELKKFHGQLKGKIVLNGGEQPIAARFAPQAVRFTDEELAAMTQPQGPRGAGGRGRPGGNRPQNAALGAQKLRFFMDEGVALVLDESRGDDGTIYVQSAAVPPATMPATTPVPTGGARPAPRPRGPSVWDASAPKTLPQVTVSAEQYNRMVRMINQGEKLQMSVELKTEFFDKDPMAYNTTAEIPGTDLKDQIVMVGGHMDSWHAGTGATDNGAGLVVGMEAVRILQALHLKPRRTIRVALWSGEEEGIFGSRYYVAQHFGNFANVLPGAPYGGAAPTDKGAFLKKPEFDKISAYFNLDNGTGKIRGVYCQGNEAVMPIFTEWLKPFHDLGAATVTIRNTGSTDHISFDAVGIPAFEFIQDVIEYGTRTHHSNQDVFDRVQGDDLKQAAVVEAAFLYNCAMRDDMLPRKPQTAAIAQR